MSNHRASIWTLPAAFILSLLCSPLRSYCGETVRAIGSLTANERNHLPDDTKVVLSWRGTVTLGTLREEHRARLERFSRAGVWGKHVADRLPKPNLPSNLPSSSLVQQSSSQNAGSQPNFNVNRSAGQVNFGDGQQGRAPAQQKQSNSTGGSLVVNQGVATIQNSSALGPSSGGSKTVTTSGGQPQQKQGSATGSNGLGGGIYNSGSNRGPANQGVATIQNSSALGSSGGGSNASATSAVQRRQNQGGTASTGGNGLGGGISNSASEAGGPKTNAIAGSGGNGPGAGSGGSGQGGGIYGAKSATGTVVPTYLFLVSLQKYKGPIPADYSLFCDAAQASSCIYLPPNTTFATPASGSLLQGLRSINLVLQGQVDQFVADVDPLITDAATCSSFGGKLDGLQQCEFLYPFVQQTKFKPNGKPSSAAYCDQPSSYQIDPKGGSITATYPLPYSYPTVATGATPVTCVVQEWIYP